MMKTKRLPLFLILIVASLLLGACSELEQLTENADVSEIENAEFYNNLQQTVVDVQIPVIVIGLVNLLFGWRLRRAGLVINGFVIGGLLIYTYLNNADLVDDANLILGGAIAGGFMVGVLAFFAYNLMALLIGGAIGTTLMGGAWLQVAENVPPQLLVFVTTFISAMVMFVVFRLFLVAFSAIIGAALLMLAVPFETLWVLPVAGIGVLIQTGIALWLKDDIFSNLRGDLGAAVSESFGEVLGPFGILRDRQREAQPAAVPQQPRQKAAKPVPQQQPSQPQAYQQPAQQQPPAYHQAQQPAPPAYHQPVQQQPPAYQQPPQQPAPPAYQPPAYQPPPQAPVQQAPQVPIQPTPPPESPPTAAHQAMPAGATQPGGIHFDPKVLQLQLSDGRTVSLEGSQITIGRNPDNHVVVADPQVSGHHLILSIQPEGVVAWDNNSTNGTYLNGQLLTGSRRLLPSDVIRIGDLTLRVVKRPTSTLYDTIS